MEQQDDEHRKELARWQQKLLPFVVATMLTMASVFIVAVALTYFSLTRAMHDDEPAPLAQQAMQMSMENVSLDFQESFERVALEERAIRNRYRMNYTILELSTWTRLIGFASGMILILSGCVFVISKFEVAFEASGKQTVHEGSLKTNSPGLVLAIAGTVLLAVSLWIRADLQINDSSTYMPPPLIPVAASATMVLPPTEVPASQAGSKDLVAPSHSSSRPKN